MWLMMLVAELEHLISVAPSHQAGKIVGDALAADRTIQAFQDKVGRLRPAQVA